MYPLPTLDDMITIITYYLFPVITNILAIVTFIFAFFVKKTYRPKKEPQYIWIISIFIVHYRYSSILTTNVK